MAEVTDNTAENKGAIMLKDITGIWGILLTPFTEQGDIDWESFDREIDYCLTSGMQGIVAPAVASEFYALTDRERHQIVHTLSQRTKDRLPFVIGVSAPYARQAAIWAQEASDQGATAVMAMPPYVGHFQRPAIQDLIEYFRAIAEAVTCPVILQNTPSYFSGSMSLDVLTRVIEAVPRITYVKEEGVAAAFRMIAIRETFVSQSLSLIGGIGGLYLLTEAACGAQAWMPACEVGDVLAKVVAALDREDQDTAQLLYHRLLPVLVAEQLMGMVWAKAVLRRRGIFRTVTMRAPSVAWGPIQEAELNRLWPIIQDLASVPWG